MNCCVFLEIFLRLLMYSLKIKPHDVSEASSASVTVSVETAD